MLQKKCNIDVTFSKSKNPKEQNTFFIPFYLFVQEKKRKQLRFSLHPNIDYARAHFNILFAKVGALRAANNTVPKTIGITKLG